MPFEFTGGQSAATAGEIQELRSMLATLDQRLNGLETLGHFVGTFDTYGDVPTNVSDYEVITINDFVNVRTDETHNGDITRYIASAIAADGTITWQYDIAYDADVSGKLDVNGQAADSARLGGKLPSHYYSLDNVPPAGGVINSPHTWPIWDDVKKEVDFGDGSYGRRYKNKISALSDTGVLTVLDDSFVGKIMQSGGYVNTGQANGMLALNTCSLSSAGTLGFTVGFTAGLYTHYTTGKLTLETLSHAVRKDCPYDVWIIYTK